MLGLYCYRAGYYPAALAKWTRIPESNRKLRPSVQHLLEELNSRLALEEQETQPMRREQILRQQPPVITGSLRPADLPNPHEPVRSEEIQDGHLVSWTEAHQQKEGPQGHSSPKNNDNHYQQQPVPQDQIVITTNSHNGHTGNTLNGEEQPHNSTQSAGKQHWLSRMLHRSPTNEHS